MHVTSNPSVSATSAAADGKKLVSKKRASLPLAIKRLSTVDEDRSSKALTPSVDAHPTSLLASTSRSVLSAAPAGHVSLLQAKIAEVGAQLTALRTFKVP
jgi:hypothetical protein